MGWGSAFDNAWNSATDVAKAAANRLSTGAEWIGDKSADAAQWLADKAREGYNAAKQAAQRAATAAKAAGRDAMRRVADAGYDAVAGVGEKARKASERLSNAYRKVKETFGAGPAASLVKPCEGKTGDGGSDSSRDGWVMVPQGPGKPCLAIPPGKGALEKARDAAYASVSGCCAAKQAAGEAVRDIIYVNGITTGQETHCATLNQIAEQTCGRVTGVYNATEGGVRDALQTGQDRALVKAADAGKSALSGDGRNPAVDTLRRQILSEIRKGNSPEVWAHSQGGAVTSLALYEASNAAKIATGNPNPLGDMVVKSFGSAAPSWVDGPAYQHFVHANDPVPSLFGLGHRALLDDAAGGVGAQVIRFAGDPESALPFALDPARKALDALPTNIGNHSIGTSYLKMEKQLNGGCP